MSSGSSIITLKVGRFVELVLWDLSRSNRPEDAYYEISITYEGETDDSIGFVESAVIETLTPKFMSTPAIAILKLGKLFNLVLDIANEEDFKIVKDKLEKYLLEALI